MTKTKQWKLSVILAAVVILALFCGIMISTVYTTAQAEDPEEDNRTKISFADISVSIKMQDNLYWDFDGNADDEGRDYWNLSDGFYNAIRDDYDLIGERTYLSDTSSDGFYSKIKIASVSRQDGVSVSNNTQIVAGTYTVKIAILDETTYAWQGDENSYKQFTLVVTSPINLRNVTAKVDFIENTYWDFSGTGDEPELNYWSLAQNLNSSIDRTMLMSGYEFLNDMDFFDQIEIESVQQLQPMVQDIADGSRLNAGGYFITVKLKANSAYHWEDENDWSTHQIELTVNPKQIDLGSFESVHWVLDLNSSTSDLRSGTVYVYSYKTELGTDRMYYSMSQLSTAPNAGWTQWQYVNSQEINHSLVRYRGSNTSTNHVIKLIFADIPDTSTAGISISYQTNSASSVGQYKAIATLEVSNEGNYIFGTQFDSAGALERGMKITVDEVNHGRSATIEKSWYLAYYNNALLNEQASIDAQEPVDFEIPSWTFGQNPQVACPRLQHGQEDGQEDLFTCVLVKDGNSATTWTNITSLNWAQYFNRYMPAGNYTITFNVSSSNVSTHTHWWDNEQHEEEGSVTFQGFTQTFNFTVRAATLTVDESNVNAHNNSSAQADRVNFNNLDYADLFNRANQLVCSGYVTKSDRTGTAWENEDRLYDEAPEYSFNIARQFNDVYMEADSANWSHYIQEPGRYQIMYRVSMKNYVTFPADSRYEHYFVVNLYKVISREPVLAKLTFTTTPQRPYLINTDTDSKYYTVADGQTFLDVGTHDVRVVIRPEYRDYILWSENDTTGERMVQLTIAQDANYWEETPYINGWVYGAATPTPRGKAHHYSVSNGDKLVFAFYQVVNGEIVGLDSKDVSIERFAVGNNRIVPVGSYVMRTELKVVNNENYDGLKASDVYFEVTPATNYWIVSPTMKDWRYGDYNAADYSPVAKAAHYNEDFGDRIDFTYRRVNDNGEIIMTGDPVVLSATTPVGNYVLIATFALGRENNNYSGINSQVSYFKVMPNDNSWTATPVTAWQYGAYADEKDTQTAKARFFDSATDTIVYTYYKTTVNQQGVAVKDEASKTTDINALKVDGKVPVGTYIMVVSVNAGADKSYGSLSTEYQVVVSQADNYWTETPHVASWAVGEAQNTPAGKAAFGNALIVVKDGDGNEMYNSSVGTDWLRACVAGWYTLEASVEGTRDYAGVRKYTTEFRVFAATAQSQVTMEGTAQNGDDTATVKVVAGVLDGTKVNLTFIAEDQTAYKDGKKILEANGYKFGTAFAVELVYENKKVLPDGTVEVTVSIPKNLANNSGLRVFSIVNGVVDPLSSRIDTEKGTITFRTNNLGTHYLAYSANQSTTGTGFVIAIIAMVILIVGLVVVAIFVIRNSRKEREALEEADDYDEE